jgi:hypothetical protein
MEGGVPSVIRKSIEAKVSLLATGALLCKAGGVGITDEVRRIRVRDDSQRVIDNCKKMLSPGCTCPGLH